MHYPTALFGLIRYSILWTCLYRPSINIQYLFIHLFLMLYNSLFNFVYIVSGSYYSFHFCEFSIIQLNLYLLPVVLALYDIIILHTFCAASLFLSAQTDMQIQIKPWFSLGVNLVKFSFKKRPLVSSFFLVHYMCMTFYS